MKCSNAFGTSRSFMSDIKSKLYICGHILHLFIFERFIYWTFIRSFKPVVFLFLSFFFFPRLHLNLAGLVFDVKKAYECFYRVCLWQRLSLFFGYEHSTLGLLPSLCLTSALEPVADAPVFRRKLPRLSSFATAVWHQFQCNFAETEILPPTQYEGSSG